MNINLSLTPAEALELKLTLANRIADNIHEMPVMVRSSLFRKLPRLEWLEAKACETSPPPDAYEPGVMIPGVHQPEAPPSGMASIELARENGFPHHL